MGWLFGAIGKAGIQLPKSFDIAGIFDLVMQVLGLTYRQIRARVVKLVGEKAMTKLEQTVDVFKVLVTEGIPGLWRWIKDKVGDLEDVVIGGIKSFIIEKVIKAGVTWLIAFLNPAAAFIKACKMIYDVIMFIIERGSEIMDFVRSILDSVGAIAKGAIGVVAEKVESSLAKALPLAISFLASLLGLGGISEKIKSIIDKVQAPIGKAVDAVVMGAVKGAKKLFGGAAKWAKGKIKKGKDWVKDKWDAAKERVKGKQPGDDPDKKSDEAETPTPEAAGTQDDKRSAAEKQAAVSAAVQEVEAARQSSENPTETAEQKMPQVKAKYGLKDIKLVEDAPGKHHVQAEINPVASGTSFGFGRPKEAHWSGLQNDCGTYMLAYIYPGTDVLKGSAPQGGTWPSWWNAAKPASSDWWVRGHLLNERLGGPGTKENLTPITKATNSRHHSTVEKLVKAAQSKNKMLAYSVKAIYDGVGPSLVDDRSKNPDKSVWPMITRELDCEWEFFDENSDMTASGAATITNEHRA